MFKFRNKDIFYKFTAKEIKLVISYGQSHFEYFCMKFSIKIDDKLREEFLDYMLEELNKQTIPKKYYDLINQNLFSVNELGSVYYINFLKEKNLV